MMVLKYAVKPLLSVRHLTMTNVSEYMLYDNSDHITISTGRSHKCQWSVVNTIVINTSRKCHSREFQLNGI